MEHYILVVSRHPAMIDWLVMTHQPHWVREPSDWESPVTYVAYLPDAIDIRILSHATEDDVRGRHVYGTLPYHLAALTLCYWAVDMPGLTPDMRGRELSVEDMIAAGARETPYIVRTADAYTAARNEWFREGGEFAEDRIAEADAEVARLTEIAEWRREQLHSHMLPENPPRPTESGGGIGLLDWIPE
jgi:hypothetical protein